MTHLFGKGQHGDAIRKLRNPPWTFGGRYFWGPSAQMIRSPPAKVHSAAFFFLFVPQVDEVSTLGPDRSKHFTRKIFRDTRTLETFLFAYICFSLVVTKQKVSGGDKINNWQRSALQAASAAAAERASCTIANRDTGKISHFFSHVAIFAIATIPLGKTMPEVCAMIPWNKHHTAEEYATPPNLRALPLVPLLFASV